MPYRFFFLPVFAALVAAPALADVAPAAIPEPGSLSLLVLGATGLIVGRRFSRRR